MAHGSYRRTWTVPSCSSVRWSKTIDVSLLTAVTRPVMAPCACISLGVNGNLFTTEFGGFNLSTGLDVRYRPIASLEISTGPGFTRNYDLAQYVDRFADPVATATAGARYVFATLDQKEFSLQTRATYAQEVPTA